MELEFDKEIDAILRKGRANAAVSTVAGMHLDADTIAAFAENALPASARVLYMEHFADCDRCRGQLSSAILMNKEADAAAASTIWPPVEKLAAATPWYSKIFRTPSLALAMGTLVLVFSAVLGYIVLQRQNQSAANSSMVSQSKPAADNRPFLTGESNAVENTNTSPQAMSNATNSALQPSVGSGAVGTASNTSSSVSAPSVNNPMPAMEEKENEDRKLAEGAPAEAPKPPAPAGVAAPPPADQPKTERDEVTTMDDAAGAGKDKALAQTETSRGRTDREAIPQAMKKAGPTRAAGPLNNNSQQQMNSGIGEMRVTRNVGGKTFFNRNGAWIDTAYSSQTVTLVRRGSDEFKKLDGGLRSIANELYGTVIVVWKGKTYRIV